MPKPQKIKVPAKPSKGLKDMFKKYAGGGEDIEDEGMEAFFSDLGIDSQDPVTLVISFYMDAKEMGIYKEEEFAKGFNDLGCKTIADMKNQLNYL
jgi:hypothetical protein